MFSWLKTAMKPSLAIAGIIDAGIKRLSEYEFRIYSGCDNGRVYQSFTITKRPEFIDLDGDGKPDR